MSIAAIYARKSTEQTGVTDEQKSVARQVEQARMYATSKGWIVADEHVYIDDGISGAEFSNRPGFLRLMNAIKPRSPFGVLVMSDIDRLGRDSVETPYAVKQLNLAGVQVFTYLEDKEIRLDSPLAALITQVQAFGAAIEREKARQRTYDAMLRKARAGHVTGGRVFGYDNVTVFGAGGQRSHVERRINEAEAAVVRRIFELCAQGFGAKSIAKTLNEAGELPPRAQQGRPAGWSNTSVWEVLRRPLYRGQIVWNRTQKRDSWGRKQPQYRDEEEWLRVDAPHLRIVPENLWQAAHVRLAAAHEDYIKATGGRVWGRPVNGTRVVKYLLPGLAQCAVCGGGLLVHSRNHGTERARFYVCSSNHNKGRTICANGQVLPMALIDGEVLTAFREELLDPIVMDRAFLKLRERLSAPGVSGKDRAAVLGAELHRVEDGLGRLTKALADGGDIPALLEAIRERDAQRKAILREIEAVQSAPTPKQPDADTAIQELRRRVRHWQFLLTEETTQARQMLGTLLKTRIVFTPQPEQHSVVFEARGHYDELFAGLISLPASIGVGVPKWTCARVEVSTRGGVPRWTCGLVETRRPARLRAEWFRRVGLHHYFLPAPL